MKLVIAGSRKMNLRHEDIKNLMDIFGVHPTDSDLIISGGASGVDTAAEVFADQYGIPFQKFKADWDKHGKYAGPLRNEQMAMAGDALLLIWDGKSRGSSKMKQRALEWQLPIYEVILSGLNN